MRELAAVGIPAAYVTWVCDMMACDPARRLTLQQGREVLLAMEPAADGEVGCSLNAVEETLRAPYHRCYESMLTLAFLWDSLLL